MAEAVELGADGGDGGAEAAGDVLHRFASEVAGLDEIAINFRMAGDTAAEEFDLVLTQVDLGSVVALRHGKLADVFMERQ